MAKTSPVKNEKIVIGATNSTWNLHGAIWNGSTWSTKDFETFCFRLPMVRRRHRNHEREYHGRGVQRPSLKYWIWDGSTWVVNGATISLSLGSGYKTWVKLAPNPRSNEIAMVFLDSLTTSTAPSGTAPRTPGATSRYWKPRHRLETTSALRWNTCMRQRGRKSHVRLGHRLPTLSRECGPAAPGRRFRALTLSEAHPAS